MGCRNHVLVLMVLIAASRNIQVAGQDCTRAMTILDKAFPAGNGSFADPHDEEVKIGTECAATESGPDNCQKGTIRFLQFGEQKTLITPIEWAYKCTDGKCGCAEEDAKDVGAGRCLKEGLKAKMECVDHTECGGKLLCLPRGSKDSAHCRVCTSSARKLQISRALLLLLFIIVGAVLTAPDR